MKLCDSVFILNQNKLQWPSRTSNNLPVLQRCDVTELHLLLFDGLGGLLLNEPDVDGLGLFGGLQLVDVEDDEVVLAREVSQVAVVGVERNLETHACQEKKQLQISDLLLRNSAASDSIAAKQKQNTGSSFNKCSFARK